MFAITELAAQKIRQIADEEGASPSVRATIRGAGCSGYLMELDFDDKKTDADESFELDDVRVLIHEICVPYFQETTLDYEKVLMGGGFKFRVANATSSCGCGKSVSFR